MRQETKRELSTWAQYLIIAFIAESLAFVAFFPKCNGCAYQLSPLFSNMWEQYEQPRLRTWFVIFIVLTGVRFVVAYIMRRRTTT